MLCLESHTISMTLKQQSIGLVCIFNKYQSVFIEVLSPFLVFTHAFILLISPNLVLSM